MDTNHDISLLQKEFHSKVDHACFPPKYRGHSAYAKTCMSVFLIAIVTIGVRRDIPTKQQALPPTNTHSVLSVAAEASDGSALIPVVDLIPMVEPPKPTEVLARTEVAQADTRGLLERMRARRRESAGLSAHYAAPLIFETQNTTNTLSQRGVYLTGNSVRNDEFLDSTLQSLQEAGGNALVIDVKGSYVYFQSSAPLANELGTVAPLYDLPAIVATAHAHNVEVIARFIAIKDHTLTKLAPETQVRHPTTGRIVVSTWVDPSHEVTLRYNREILETVVQAGVDEVNLDYIRYTTEVPQHTIGLTGEQKADRIMEFLQMARTTIDAINPETRLGISTYAILGWNFPVNFEPLGQDIGRFAEIVDVVSPMAYPATFAVGHYYSPGKDPVSRMYHLVHRTLEGYKELMGDNAHKIRPWIQGYGVTEKNIIDQIQAVHDTGACGFTFWNASNAYAPTYSGMAKKPLPSECL